MTMKRTDTPFFTPEQIKLITNDLLKGAPEFEIQRFLITCERTGLDPFSRQIYGHLQNKKQRKPGVRGNDQNAYEYVKTVTIITSIDGFRAIGERSGQYRGQTQPQWYYVNAEGESDWHDVFITARDRGGNPLKTPDACRVGVLREGFQSPCYGVANFDSFAKFFKEEGGTGWVLDTFWKKMPEHMIAKVAEAQAFRKAFPLLACGLFIEEEAQSEDDEAAAPGHDLPAGATAIHSLPPAQPPQPAAPPQTPEPPKPAETPVNPGEPKSEAPAKRTRKVATDQAPPENPAKPSPAPEKPATPPQTPPPANPPPVTPPAPQEPAKPAAAGGWQDYTITQVTMGEFQNKKLGDLTAKQIEFLKINWIDKYGHKIAQNPAKVADADQIKIAFAHHFRP